MCLFVDLLPRGNMGYGVSYWTAAACVAVDPLSSYLGRRFGIGMWI